MNISGIRPSAGFYNYNEIAKVAEQTTAPETENVSANQASEEAAVVTGRTPETEAKQTFGAYDYASQYNSDATYSLKGADSDIRSLDVEKAVSDMRKDEVLHQYQYFVGDSPSAEVAAATASSVRGAEDFSL